MWTLAALLIQFAVFFIDFGFVPVDQRLQSNDYKGKQLFRLRAWRLKFVSSSWIYPPVGKASVEQRMHAKFRSKVLGTIWRFVESMFVILGGRPSAKSFPFIELTQSNQPSSHLSDFPLIGLIIMPTTHTHARAGCEIQSCAKRTNRKFLSDRFCCCFLQQLEAIVPPSTARFLPSPEKSTSRI